MTECGQRLKPMEAWLDRSRSRARGLLIGLPMLDRSTALFDHARQVYGVATAGAIGSVILGSVERGPCLSHTNTGDYQTLLADSSVLPTAACTVVLGYRKRDTVQRQSAAFGVASISTGAYLNIHLPWSDGNVYWDFGGTGGSNRLTVSGLTFGDDLWVLTAGRRGMEIWQNGVRRAVSATAVTRSANSAPFVLGGNIPAFGVASDLADYWLFELYDRQMEIGEIVDDVYADPHGLYRVPEPAPFFGIAAVIVPVLLEGLAQAGASHSVAASVQRLLSGRPSAEAIGAAALQVSRTLTGIAGGAAISEAQALVSRALAGVSPGASVVATQLRVSRELAAAALSLAVAHGDLTAIRLLAGLSVGGASQSSRLTTAVLVRITTTYLRMLSGPHALNLTSGPHSLDVTSGPHTLEISDV